MNKERKKSENLAIAPCINHLIEVICIKINSLLLWICYTSLLEASSNIESKIIIRDIDYFDIEVPPSWIYWQNKK